MVVGTIILSIGIFNGIMLSVILWMNKRQRFLAVGILVYSLLLLKYLGYWVEFLPEHQILAEQLRSTELLMGPLILGGILRMQGLRLTREWLHYVPFLILVLILAVYTAAQIGAYGSVSPFFPDRTMQIKLAHELVYLAYVMITLKKWSRPLILLVGFFALQWIISVFYAIFRFDQSLEVVNIILFAGMSFAINYLAFIALRNTSLFTKEQNEEVPTDTEPVASANRVQSEEPVRIDIDLQPIFDDIAQVLEVQRLYLNHNLKISGVSEKLKIQEKLISKAVNEHAGENFNAYINRFRVDHAASLIISDTHSHFTIDAIAEESGFANKVSFYKAFKRVKGVSPSEFRKENSDAVE